MGPNKMGEPELGSESQENVLKTKVEKPMGAATYNVTRTLDELRAVYEQGSMSNEKYENFLRDVQEQEARKNWNERQESLAAQADAETLARVSKGRDVVEGYDFDEAGGMAEKFRRNVAKLYADGKMDYKEFMEKTQRADVIAKRLVQRRIENKNAEQRQLIDKERREIEQQLKQTYDPVYVSRLEELDAEARKLSKQSEVYDAEIGDESFNEKHDLFDKDEMVTLVDFQKERAKNEKVEKPEKAEQMEQMEQEGDATDEWTERRALMRRMPRRFRKGLLCGLLLGVVGVSAFSGFDSKRNTGSVDAKPAVEKESNEDATDLDEWVADKLDEDAETAEAAMIKGGFLVSDEKGNITKADYSVEGATKAIGVGDDAYYDTQKESLVASFSSPLVDFGEKEEDDALADVMDSLVSNWASGSASQLVEYATVYGILPAADKEVTYQAILSGDTVLSNKLTRKVARAMTGKGKYIAKRTTLPAHQSYLTMYAHEECDASGEATGISIKTDRNCVKSYDSDIIAFVNEDGKNVMNRGETKLNILKEFGIIDQDVNLDEARQMKAWKRYKVLGLRNECGGQIVLVRQELKEKVSRGGGSNDKEHIVETGDVSSKIHHGGGGHENEEDDDDDETVSKGSGRTQTNKYTSKRTIQDQNDAAKRQKKKVKSSKGNKGGKTSAGESVGEITKEQQNAGANQGETINEKVEDKSNKNSVPSGDQGDNKARSDEELADRFNQLSE